VGPANYYGHLASRVEAINTVRFPRNHVRYSRALGPLELLNAAHVRWGKGPLGMRDALLREFDASAPLHHHLGTREELDQLRATVQVMFEGWDSNPFLSGVGRVLLRRMCTSMLRARRGVLEHYDANRPVIEASGRLEAPLLITGLPRTGSTLLQRLLAEDPGSRSPRTYEMEVPLPPLARDADSAADPRIRASGAVHGTARRFAPGLVEKMSESHRWDPIEFEESFLYMLAHSGLVMMNSPAAGSRGIDALLTLEGKRPVLRYERLFFTMLDAYRPARSHWTLKAPNYAPVFPLVFEEYPDVRMVITHRNPLLTFPSVCRLLESWNIAFDRDGSFDKHRFAALVGKLMDACIEVPARYRKSHPEKDRQIFDCLYDEFFADPIAMVERIYAFFDLEVTPEFVSRMKTYLRNNRQGKYGRHRYSLEEYGIDGGAYCEAHRDYMTKYGFGLAGAKGPRPKSLTAAAE